MSFLRVLQLQFIFWSVCNSLRGRDLMGEEERKRKLFVPCLPEDSVFMKGQCVICNRPYRYENAKKCNSFVSAVYNDIDKRFRKIRYVSESSIKSGTNFTRYYPLQHVSQTNSSRCAVGFGCLRNQCDIETVSVFVGAAYLNKRKLRVVTIQRLPFVKIIGGKYSGVCFELINAIQIKYNFSTNPFLPYDGNWGAKTKNGTWNGMVGQVLRKEADIGVAGFSVTLERSRVIAFTSSYHQEPTGILIPPPTEGEKLSVIIRPLSPQVWAVLGTTVLILAPSLYIMHVTSIRISHKAIKIQGFFQLTGDLINFMIGSLLQESVISPVDKTTRFLVILWWLLTFIVSNIYVAYLVSYLSAPKLFNVVDSLDDLVQQSSIKWTFRLNTAHQSLFKSESSSGVYKIVGDGVSLEDLVQSDTQGVQKVLSGEFAFIKEKSYLDVALGQDFVNTQECRMTVAKETFFKVETALIVQKESPFLDLINMEIIRSVTTGLMEKWKMLHWPKDLFCNDAASYISNTRPKTRKLQLDDLQGAFFLWTIGVILSVLAFIPERLFHQFCKFTSRKKNCKRQRSEEDRQYILDEIQHYGRMKTTKKCNHQKKNQSKVIHPILNVRSGNLKNNSPSYSANYWNYIK